MPDPEDKNTATWARLIACGLLLFLLGIVTGLAVLGNRPPLAVIRLDAPPAVTGR